MEKQKIKVFSSMEEIEAKYYPNSILDRLGKNLDEMNHVKGHDNYRLTKFSKDPKSGIIRVGKSFF